MNASSAAALTATESARSGLYSVVDADVRRDREAVIGIWRGNLGREARFAAKYDWFYLGCPWGEPRLKVLRHEPSGEWVGVAALGPRRMLWNGREIRAGVLVDMAVAARHRSLGPAMTLQREVAACAGREFDLVYGFPNPKAVPVVKRVGYAKLADIVRGTRVLRHGAYLRRILPPPLARPLGRALDGVDRIGDLWRAWRHGRRAAEWSGRVDPRMHALWTRTEPGGGLVSVRDDAALRWRFDEGTAPDTRYLLVAAASGALEAWFACEAAGTTLHVRDFWPRVPTRAAIEALVRAARAARHVSVSMQCTELSGAWRAARFVERDRRPVYGLWRAALGPIAAGPIHLTPADEDE